MTRFQHGIDWSKSEHFNPDEWPAGVLGDMEPHLFHNGLFPLRERSGVAMSPSIILEGHVRTKGDSRHSLKGGTRKSDASDLFIGLRVNDVASVFRHAQAVPGINGVGLYFDTKGNDGKPSVMVHIDMRPERLLWIRVDGLYIYEPNDPAFFYRELANQLEKLR